MKKLVATISLMVVLMVGNVFAGGLILGDLVSADQQQQPCTTNQNEKGWIPTDSGIIVTFTGIIVTLFEDDNATETNCGIILSD